ncbi:hypothetical protein DITRI_Ditri18aG0050500 [Diplodiscus trichospermus]
MKWCAAALFTFTLAVLLGSTIADVTDIISQDLYETMLNHRNPFYSYKAFVAAARSFNGFGTTGGWDNAPEGKYAWGYYFIEQQIDRQAYCDGAGHALLFDDRCSNYNYKQAGDHSAIRRDLINNPEHVATDATISFKTVIWFWMTPQGNKPSSHEVIIGRWRPSAADQAAGRVPGYGTITNIINGGIECGRGPHPNSGDRIGFYKR